MPTLSLNVLPLRAGLIADGPNTVEVLVRVTGPKAPTVTTARPALNLALVLDRSGSMSGRPLAEARRAAEAIVERLLPADRLALVAYDHRARVLVPSRRVTEKAVFTAALAELDSGGNTDLHAGWEAGVREVQPWVAPSVATRVLLLSDGQANAGISDPEALAQAGADAAGKGVATSTYGLGQGFNEQLMMGMARHGQGRSYYGESAEDLLDPFLEEFEFLAARCATDVRVTVIPAAGVKVLQRTDHAPVGTLSWRLPELAWESEAMLLLRLEVEALPAGGDLASLMEVACTWVNPDHTAGAAPGLALALPVLEAEAYGALPEDALVRERLREVEATRLEAMAYQAALDGDMEKVQEALDALRKLGQDDPWIQAREQELRDLAQRRSNLFAKEAFYGFTSSSPMSLRSSNYDEEAEERYLRKKKRFGTQNLGSGSTGSTSEPGPLRP